MEKIEPKRTNAGFGMRRKRPDATCLRREGCGPKSRTPARVTVDKRKPGLYMHMQGDKMAVNDSDTAPPASIPGSAGRMIGGVDCRDVAGCTCLRLRRAGRMATQIFDAHLQPAGLTIGQFGIMTQIYGSSLSRPPMTMKELSNAIGMDPTTLNRTLKPLEAQRLVGTNPDGRD